MSSFIDLLLRRFLCVCSYCQTSVFVPEEAFDEEGYIDLECHKCATVSTYKLTTNEGESDGK